MRFLAPFDMISVVSIMFKATQEWVKQAEYDIDTAEQMLVAGRYLYVVFFCHLAIEKMLKAAVTEYTEPMARLYLQHSKEVLRWIKEQLP